MSSSDVLLTVEFSGGLESLFDNQHSIQISLPKTDSEGKASNMTFLVEYLCQNVMSSGSRKELFTEGRSVRPGILVLINDVDWELEGEEGYVISNGDRIRFMSTLHGG